MGYADAGGEKAKSLVKIKQEKADKKVLRARAKLEHSTLSEFIRFVDYMVVETLVSLAVDTTSAFHDELIKPRKSGVFETMVGALGSIVDGVDRCGNAKSFNSFFSMRNIDGGNVEDVITLPLFFISVQR
jgi:hypothetical protein